jgi:UPF0716 protein FxsA
MRLLLLFLFLAYPLLEIAVMIKVGGAIGVWPLLGIIVATVALGTAALHRHGFTMLQRMAEDMAAGRPPVGAMMEGALVAMAGLMLIAPGLITDVLGLALLIPPLRRWLADRISGRLPFEGAAVESSRRTEDELPDTGEPEIDGRFREPSDARHRPAGQRAARTPIVIDGEYERIDERTIDPDKSKAPPRAPAND